MNAGKKIDEKNELREDRKELALQIKKAIIERLSLNITTAEISDDAELFGSGLNLDSVDALEIAIILELKFGVPVSDDELASFKSIDTLVDLVQNRAATGRLHA